VFDSSSQQLRAFIDACRSQRSPLADTLALEVLSLVDGHESERVTILLEALDAGRAENGDAPAFEMLRGMFASRSALGESQYEVGARSANGLRVQLYARAKGMGASTDASRKLLASLERGRREDGRPLDEPRHPAVEDQLSWTDALLQRTAESNHSKISAEVR
jgi:hypothetical protein